MATIAVTAPIRVNTAVQNIQYAQQTSSLSTGIFITAWTDASGGIGGATGDSSGSAVKAQLFNSDGVRLGTELLINTATNSFQGLERIIPLSSGYFAILWADLSGGVGGASGDASSSALKLQLIGVDGSKFGSEQLVNTATNGSQLRPQSAELSNGSFVITWADESLGIGGAEGDTSGSAVKAQLFSADGNKIGTEFLVNSETINDQVPTGLAALPDGSFVVTWKDTSGTTGDTSGTALKAQVFTADGSKIGNEILVNSATSGDQWNSIVVPLVYGGFAVCWTDESLGVGGAQGDQSYSSIKAQVFSADGTKAGSEILVNTKTLGVQTSNQMVALDSGGFAIVWVDSLYPEGILGESIRAQIFGPDGRPVGTEITINSTALYYAEIPKITALPGGSFLVRWINIDEVNDGINAPTSNWTVKAQTFSSSGSRIGDEIQIPTSYPSDQDGELIANLGNGRVAITWQDEADVFSQVYSVLSNYPPPQITSNGGGPIAAISITENNVAVTTVIASDISSSDKLVYSIIGGVDATLFDIDSNSGAVTFIQAPDFEKPADFGADNNYELFIQVSDGELVDTQRLSIAIQNDNEAPLLSLFDPYLSTFDITAVAFFDVTPGSDLGRAIDVQPDGKILIGGTSQQFSSNIGNQLSVVRIDPDGVLDESFGNQGIYLSAPDLSYKLLRTLLVQSDGGILLAGDVGGPVGQTIVRLTPDGQPDATFGIDGSVFIDGSLPGGFATVQNDGKTILVGNSLNGPDRDYFITRLMVSGLLDETFGSGGSVTVDIGQQSNIATSVLAQSDGKLLIVGFSNVAGLNSVDITRLNSDGSVDTGFGQNGFVVLSNPNGYSFTFDSAILKADGKLLIANNVLSSNRLYTEIIQLNTDGSLDINFGVNGVSSIPLTDIDFLV